MLRVRVQISPDGALLLEGQVDLRVVLQAASVDNGNVFWIFSEPFDKAVWILVQGNNFNWSDGLEIGVGKEIEADWIIVGPLGGVSHGAGAGADEEEGVRCHWSSGSQWPCFLMVTRRSRVVPESGDCCFGRPTRMNLPRLTRACASY